MWKAERRPLSRCALACLVLMDLVQSGRIDTDIQQPYKSDLAPAGD